MARHHARLLTAIWNDPDFRALDSPAQRMYMLLISQPDLNACGVIGYRPKVWARLAPDTTPQKIARAAATLAARCYTIIDRDTDELWVRSFMRHDGVLASPNIFKSAARAFDTIHSATIRTGILDALPEPLVKGFPERFLQQSPKAIGEQLREAFEEPLLDHSYLPPPASLLPNPADNPNGRRGDPAEPPTSRDDDDEDHRLVEVWPIVAERRLAEQRAAGQRIGSVRSWLTKVEAEARAEQTDRARTLLAQYPQLSTGQLADALNGHTNVLRTLQRASS